jgi:hypothetical protein
MIDGIGAHAQSGELAPGHHPVLTLRDLRNRPVMFTRLSFAAYYAVKVRLVAHGTQHRAPWRTRG